MLWSMLTKTKTEKKRDPGPLVLDRLPDESQLFFVFFFVKCHLFTIMHKMSTYTEIHVHKKT